LTRGRQAPENKKDKTGSIMMHAAATTPARFFSAGSALGLFAVALGALPFWVGVVPPLDDLPAHVLVVRVVTQYGNPELNFAEYFSIDWGVAPTSLFYVVMTWLQGVVGPVTDARVYLTVFVAAMWISVWCLSRSLGEPQPWRPALMALPIVFCWYVYNGFLPFLMSLPLFVFAIAIWYADWRATLKVPALAALLVCLFGFHIVGAAAAGAVIATAACLQYAFRGRRPATLVQAALALAPLVALTAWYMLGQSHPQVHPAFASPLAQLVDTVKFTVTTLDETAALILLVSLGALGVVLLWRWRELLAMPHVTGPALVIVILAVVMPQSMGALYPAGPRLLPFALVMLVAALRWSSMRNWAVVVGLVIIAGLSLLTTRAAMRFDQGYRDALAVTENIERGKRVLTILDPSVGSRWTMPYRHLGALVMTFRGGSGPYVFAAPYVVTGATPLVYRSESDAFKYAYFYEKGRGPSDYVGVSGHYDYVLLFGNLAAVGDVVEREMTRVSVSGLASLYARKPVSEDAGHPAAPLP
jgi:hypothetical protein